ncbi:MAG: DUF5103 domain-containing protein [Saprospiraceae bacterium]|nr:DUF5103 domain-containing protein [Saprospiraceae bacterium]
MKHFITLLIFSLSQNLFGSESPYRFVNSVYDPFVKTVTLEVNNLPIGFPVLELGSGQYFVLKFDDLLNEERNLFYRIVHCDKDWKPSRLSEIETIQGFNDERLRNYEYSTNTKVQYIHYWQKFPNRDTRWKVSGNFLLIIYEDNIEYPLLTRRFVVTEKKLDVNITPTFPADVANIRYKQEMLIDINFEKFKMRNPVDEISLVVMQNEDWNSTIEAKPSFFTGNFLKFNRVGTFSFFGLTEYREFDIRSTYNVGRGVQHVDRTKKYTDALLRVGEPKRNSVHLQRFDFNGKFFIQNFDAMSNRNIDDVLSNFITEVENNLDIRPGQRDSIVQSIIASNPLLGNDDRAEERNVRSDYVNVIFTMKDNMDHDDADLYVLGAMNDWEPREEYKMVYDQNKDLYIAEALLKQGYYNYMYALVKNGKVDYVTMEGSWAETENDYHSLVYYRGFGDLYDRVVGYNKFNTETIRSLGFR